MSRNKVLNARVSKKLYDKISEKAKKNRITISNLIRNLVEDALEIHEDFHDAIDKKIRKYLTDPEKQKILGFQEVTLAKDTLCDSCGQAIKASDTAYFAFFEATDKKAILCQKCKNTHATTSNS